MQAGYQKLPDAAIPGPEETSMVEGKKGGEDMTVCSRCRTPLKPNEDAVTRFIPLVGVSMQTDMHLCSFCLYSLKKVIEKYDEKVR